MIFIDATLVKHKDGGVLLAATGKDMNNDIFSIAYVVADIQNNDIWDWFCQSLKGVLESYDDYHRHYFTVMIDRHQILIK